MSPKEYYKTYQADPYVSDLGNRLIGEVFRMAPVHVLDFGCGTGKHLTFLNSVGVCTMGIDISIINILSAKVANNLPCVICADETYLRNLCNIDIVFTCSVMDHIQDIDAIIQEFQRIANNAVFLAETNDEVSDYYYAHNYESFGFEKLDFEYTGEDGAKYYIWKWQRESTKDEAFNILNKNE